MHVPRLYGNSQAKTARLLTLCVRVSCQRVKYVAGAVFCALPRGPNREVRRSKKAPKLAPPCCFECANACHYMPTEPQTRITRIKHSKNKSNAHQSQEFRVCPQKGTMSQFPNGTPKRRRATLGFGAKERSLARVSGGRLWPAPPPGKRCHPRCEARSHWLWPGQCKLKRTPKQCQEFFTGEVQQQLKTTPAGLFGPVNRR